VKGAKEEEEEEEEEDKAAFRPFVIIPLPERVKSVSLYTPPTAGPEARVTKAS